MFCRYRKMIMLAQHQIFIFSQIMDGSLTWMNSKNYFLLYYHYPSVKWSWLLLRWYNSECINKKYKYREKVCSLKKMNCHNEDETTHEYHIFHHLCMLNWFESQWSLRFPSKSGLKIFFYAIFRLRFAWIRSVDSNLEWVNETQLEVCRHMSGVGFHNSISQYLALCIIHVVSSRPFPFTWKPPSSFYHGDWLHMRRLNCYYNDFMTFEWEEEISELRSELFKPWSTLQSCTFE